MADASIEVVYHGWTGPLEPVLAVSLGLIWPFTLGDIAIRKGTRKVNVYVTPGNIHIDEGTRYLAFASKGLGWFGGAW